jgi:hypothetical protein
LPCAASGAPTRLSRGTRTRARLDRRSSHRSASRLDKLSRHRGSACVRSDGAASARPLLVGAHASQGASPPPARRPRRRRWNGSARAGADSRRRPRFRYRPAHDGDESLRDIDELDPHDAYGRHRNDADDTTAGDRQRPRSDTPSIDQRATGPRRRKRPQPPPRRHRPIGRRQQQPKRRERTGRPFPTPR